MFKKLGLLLITGLFSTLFAFNNGNSFSKVNAADNATPSYTTDEYDFYSNPNSYINRFIPVQSTQVTEQNNKFRFIQDNVVRLTGCKFKSGGAFTQTVTSTIDYFSVVVDLTIINFKISSGYRFAVSNLICSGTTAEDLGNQGGWRSAVHIGPDNVFYHCADVAGNNSHDISFSNKSILMNYLTTPNTRIRIYFDCDGKISLYASKGTSFNMGGTYTLIGTVEDTYYHYSPIKGSRIAFMGNGMLNTDYIDFNDLRIGIYSKKPSGSSGITFAVDTNISMSDKIPIMLQGSSGGVSINSNNFDVPGNKLFINSPENFTGLIPYNRAIYTKDSGDIKITMKYLCYHYDGTPPQSIVLGIMFGANVDSSTGMLSQKHGGILGIGPNSGSGYFTFLSVNKNGNTINCLRENDEKNDPHLYYDLKGGNGKDGVTSSKPLTFSITIPGSLTGNISLSMDCNGKTVTQTVPCSDYDLGGYIAVTSFKSNATYSMSGYVQNVKFENLLDTASKTTPTLHDKELGTIYANTNNKTLSGTITNGVDYSTCYGNDAYKFIYEKLPDGTDALQYGTFQLNENTGSYTYTLNQDSHPGAGNYYIYYRVNDYGTLSSRANLKITINYQSLTPISKTYYTYRLGINKAARTVNGQVSASAPDGGNITYAYETDPTASSCLNFGEIKSFNTTTGEFTYVLNDDPNVPSGEVSGRTDLTFYAYEYGGYATCTGEIIIQVVNETITSYEISEDSLHKTNFDLLENFDSSGLAITVEFKSRQKLTYSGNDLSVNSSNYDYKNSGNYSITASVSNGKVETYTAETGVSKSISYTANVSSSLYSEVSSQVTSFANQFEQCQVCGINPKDGVKYDKYQESKTSFNNICALDGSKEFYQNYETYIDKITDSSFKNLIIANMARYDRIQYLYGGNPKYVNYMNRPAQRGIYTDSNTSSSGIFGFAANDYALLAILAGVVAIITSTGIFIRIKKRRIEED